jgi:hypothetical protein
VVGVVEFALVRIWSFVGVLVVVVVEVESVEVFGAVAVFVELFLLEWAFWTFEAGFKPCNGWLRFAG